jgi:ubiquinone/menaquinone biosynthesis C-methylase UbiE
MAEERGRQALKDAGNASFWDELCGTTLARSLGITEVTPESLALFDARYLDYYPYLAGYFPDAIVDGRAVLEIGLGFGTLGGLLTRRGADYHGLDIADGPVTMMRARLDLLGMDGAARAHRGSALAVPFEDARFDCVVAIGSLHHTGDLDRSLREVERVLRPGGQAVVMVYNRHSLRLLSRLPRALVAELVRGRRTLSGVGERIRGMYDANQAGEAAPHTDFVSARDLRRMFRDYTSIRVDRRNIDPVVLRGRVLLTREAQLSTIARLLGLDLYVVAIK